VLEDFGDAVRQVIAHDVTLGGGTDGLGSQEQVSGASPCSGTDCGLLSRLGIMP